MLGFFAGIAEYWYVRNYYPRIYVVACSARKILGYFGTLGTGRGHPCDVQALCTNNPKIFLYCYRILRNMFAC